MRNIFNAALVPVLAALAFGCTSTTALQTSEPDDLYYASSDKTVRQEMGAGATQSTYSEENNASAEGSNPEYYDPEAASRTSITNNYYYDNDRYYTGRGRRNYMYYNDPFYSPFGYSAAYCYGIYDPFCFPGYYPYSGITVSIGWGNPYGYGYGGYRPYGYGYRPYDNYGYGYGYGGGYGGYYQGFYDGYHAGNGYGYGYNRQKVQYGPRGERSVVPATSTTAGSGRPASPGRVGSDHNSGRVNVDPGRVGRVAPAQSGGSPANGNTNQPAVSPGRSARPSNVAGKPVAQPGRVEGVKGTPNQETVRPENYQFQNYERPVIEESKPTRTRDVIAAPQQQERPTYQQDRPTEQAAPAQQQPQRPVRESYSRPARPVQQENRTAPTYNNDRPSYQDNSPSRSSGGNSGSSSPSRSGGRPRN